MAADIFDQLVEPAESSRLKVYDDATGQPVVPGYTMKGHPTIGVGRALDTNGISQEEELLLYQNDKDKVHSEVLVALPWLSTLDSVRLAVILAMAFQMGTNGLLAFRQMLAAIRVGNWQTAKSAMLDSAWASETPSRAEKMAGIMLTGQLPT